MGTGNRGMDPIRICSGIGMKTGSAGYPPSMYSERVSACLAG